MKTIQNAHRLYEVVTIKYIFLRTALQYIFEYLCLGLEERSLCKQLLSCFHYLLENSFIVLENASINLNTAMH